MLAELHSESAGAGSPIVLAHGFAGSARNWRPQVRALADRHRVITYDARGHARSPVEAEAADAYSMSGFVRDMMLVAERGGVEGPAIHGGLSMGAAVALHFVLAHPERSRGLVLASVAAGGGGVGSVAATASDFARCLEQEGIDAAGARYVWGPESGLDARAAQLVRQGFLEHDPTGLARTLRGVLADLPRPVELAPALARTGLPILIVAGGGDGSSLRASRELAEALPDARLEVIEGAGHVVNLHAPAEFNAILADFVGGW